VQAWIATGAAAVSASFAIFTWYQRRDDATRHARRERLHRVLDALHEVSRDAFASRYNGPNTLHSTRLRLGTVVQSAGESLPESSRVAAAKSALEIEQLEKGAFDEIGQRLAESD
jgi:hypothetical protein